MLLSQRASSVTSPTKEAHCRLSCLWAHHSHAVPSLFTYLPQIFRQIVISSLEVGKCFALIRNPFGARHIVVDTQMLVLLHLVFPRWISIEYCFPWSGSTISHFLALIFTFFFSGWSLNRDALLIRWWSFPSTIPSEQKQSPTSSTKVHLRPLGARWHSYWLNTETTFADTWYDRDFSI